MSASSNRKLVSEPCGDSANYIFAHSKDLYNFRNCRYFHHLFASFQFLALRWLYQCLEKDCYITPDTNHRLATNTNPNCKLSANDEAKTLDEKDSKSLKSNENVGDRMKNRFVCAHSSNDPRNVSNINLPIIEELSKLSSAYKNTNDQWRCFAYDKAISSIKRHPTAIGSRAGTYLDKGRICKKNNIVHPLLSIQTYFSRGS